MMPGLSCNDDVDAGVPLQLTGRPFSLGIASHIIHDDLMLAIVILKW